MARLATPPATLFCVCVAAARLAASAVLDVGTAFAVAATAPRTCPAAVPHVPVPAAVPRATDTAADCNLIATLTRLLLGLTARPCRYSLSATAG